MGQIRVSGLGKAYKQYPNRWSRLFEWLVPFSPPRHHLHWILREVEFTIEPGERSASSGSTAPARAPC